MKLERESMMKGPQGTLLSFENFFSLTVMVVIQLSILEWVAMPSSRGSSQPRDQTQVSLIAGGFFTILATKGANYLLY